MKPQVSFRSLGLLLLISLTAIVFTNCSDDDNPVTPTSSTDTREILFLSDRGGAAQLYEMDDDGGNQKRIVKDAAVYETPSWSPDGRRILCARQSAGQWDICIMNAGGSNATLLAATSSDERNPVFSPDGWQIAFESWRDGDQEIYIVDIDGTNLMRLTNHPGADRYPSWHPDGTMLSYASLDTNSGALWKVQWVNSDGTGLTTPPNCTGRSGGPTGWSNDGDWYFTMTSTQTQMSVGGTDPLTFNAGTSSARINSANWSTTVPKLIYDSGNNVGRAIGIWDASSGHLVPLWITSGLVLDVEPFWNPDASAIVFCSNRDGNKEIYVMNPDGTGPTNLTNADGSDWCPRWRVVP